MQTAFRAFSFACGLFHDLKRVQQYFRIIGYAQCSSATFIYKPRSKDSLYQWMAKNDISQYAVRMRNFRELTTDPDFALPYILDLCRRSGFFKTKSMEQAVTNPSSPEWATIRDAVDRGNWTSASHYRRDHPDSRRSPDETFRSMIQYLGLKKNYFEQDSTETYKGRKGFFLDRKFLAKVRQEMPMLDETYDLYEMLHFSPTAK